MSAAGRPVWRDLWNLTTAGLASAASEVGRPVKEMGGTARDAARAGAPHALAVTDTIDAFRQSPPLPTKPVARRTDPTTTAPVPAQARPLPLPVSGTFTTPARGSLRADAVLRAPEDGVPVMFVEVDNHTEPAAVVARKVENYRRFFQRTVKDHQGVDVPFWSTRWDDSSRAGYPPLALVFAKNVSPDTAMNRMKSIHDLSTPCWQGRWHSGSSYDRASSDGYRDYARTIPVLATTLTRLQQHGPHGPVWWRFGHPAPDTLGHPAPDTLGQPTFESLEQALDNPDDYSPYHAREERRRLEHHRRNAGARRRKRPSAGRRRPRGRARPATAKSGRTTAGSPGPPAVTAATAPAPEGASRRTPPPGPPRRRKAGKRPGGTASSAS